ncbi:hypothetical protein [uncultured Methylobacterium sp.]|uniref:hypothetical protein n=2 Tax=Hyphomicrobiales TaxID=356 RepID=UPI0025960180|nr:hypothetical protein [uncultured Methylobacterium sp.]
MNPYTNEKPEEQMTESKTNDAPEPHCVHVIGIGRTGAVYVEALLRTGEIEDNLVNEGTTFASLIVDIGDDHMQVANDYARSFKPRMASRGIPADRYLHGNVVLSTPEAGAVGKQLAAALQQFANKVKEAKHPSTVFVACSLAGKTGSVMVVNIARELEKIGLGDNVRVAGVGQLSHSGDGEYSDSVDQTKALDEIDATCGAVENNPFSGGFYVVPTEHSWQRLTAYTTTGVKEVRQSFKQMVTNRFVADSFMRWAVSDNASHLIRMIKRCGGKLNMFGIAKFSHPGVQVLPGQARSIWDAVLQQWISFVPQYSGLKEGFKTDSVEVHIYAARDMRIDVMEAELKDILVSNYLKQGSSDYQAYKNEFFDELTSYGNIILPGIGKKDLTAYGRSNG